jgi:ubiquinone/menaquinone biosynthesis C-methylase UbiE
VDRPAARRREKAQSTGFPDNSFDKVFITHAIHEMKRDERTATLEEARRVLKDGGTVAVLELDNPSSLFVRIIVGFWFFYWLPFNFERETQAVQSAFYGDGAL